MSIEDFFRKPVPAPEEYNKIFVKGDYCCPNCKTDIPDENYIFEGKKYPEIYNEGSSCSDMGHFYYWDEYHICKECETKYYIESGN